MTTAASKNGSGTTPRKQLSEQLDRLDGVIDALDEGLKGAVADAVRDAVGAAVQEAVQAVLVQMLTNPDLQRMVRQAAAPTEPPHKEQDKPRERKSLLSRAWGRVRSAVSACADGFSTAVSLARLGWAVAGARTRALVMAGAAALAGAAYAARARIAQAARGVADYVSGNAGVLMRRLAPAFAR